MNESPRALRLHIGLFGRRNAGKSSLLNALVGQDVAIVSPTPGSTADPVEKTLEMAPLGPVVFLDTAGLDDLDAPLGPGRWSAACGPCAGWTWPCWCWTVPAGRLWKTTPPPVWPLRASLCRGGQQPRGGGRL